MVQSRNQVVITVVKMVPSIEPNGAPDMANDPKKERSLIGIHWARSVDIAGKCNPCPRPTQILQKITGFKPPTSATTGITIVNTIDIIMDAAMKDFPPNVSTKQAATM